MTRDKAIQRLNAEAIEATSATGVAFKFVWLTTAIEMVEQVALAALSASLEQDVKAASARHMIQCPQCQSVALSAAGGPLPSERERQAIALLTEIVTGSDGRQLENLDMTDDELEAVASDVPCEIEPGQLVRAIRFLRAKAVTPEPLSSAETQRLLGSDRPINIGEVPTDPIGMRAIPTVVRERIGATPGQYPVKDSTGWPRRNRVDQMSVGERAIYEAIGVVETMGADVRLTNAVITLGKARDLVADFIDNIPAQSVTPEPTTPAPEQVDCPLCGQTVTLKASATLSLALWQHVNWVCPKRPTTPAPVEQARQALERAIESGIACAMSQRHPLITDDADRWERIVDQPINAATDALIAAVRAESPAPGAGWQQQNAELRAKLQEIISKREAYDAACMRDFGYLVQHAGRAGAELMAFIESADIKLLDAPQETPE